jgi:hypothetical protein
MLEKKNKEERIIVQIKPAYMGRVNLMAIIGEKHYVLNLHNVQEVIANQIKERGFTSQRTGRQIYERLTINN